VIKLHISWSCQTGRLAIFTIISFLSFFLADANWKHPIQMEPRTAIYVLTASI